MFVQPVRRVNMKYLILTILLLTPKLVSADVFVRGTIFHNAVIVPSMGSSIPAGALADDAGHYLNDDAGHYLVGQ